MAWSKDKVLPESINSGAEFTADDNLTVAELNAMVNNSFYGVDFAEAMADAPDISEIANEGIPNVTLVDNVKNGKAYKKFKFSNLKGKDGYTNKLSIGSVQSGSTASATITGEAPNQTLNLVLPKGATGEKGQKGDTALTVKVGNVTTGDAGTEASVINRGTDKDLILDFIIPRGAVGAGEKPVSLDLNLDFSGTTKYSNTQGAGLLTNAKFPSYNSLSTSHGIDTFLEENCTEDRAYLGSVTYKTGTTITAGTFETSVLILKDTNAGTSKYQIYSISDDFVIYPILFNTLNVYSQNGFKMIITNLKVFVPVESDGEGTGNTGTATGPITHVLNNSVDIAITPNANSKTTGPLGVNIFPYLAYVNNSTLKSGGAIPLMEEIFSIVTDVGKVYRIKYKRAGQLEQYGTVEITTNKNETTAIKITTEQDVFILGRYVSGTASYSLYVYTANENFTTINFYEIYE